MSSIDRRAFLAVGGSAALLSILPLAACGGSGEPYAPVSSAPKAPMAASADGLQFRTEGNSHALIIGQRDGTQRTVGGVGLVHGKLNYPVGVAVLGGLAYVVEKGNHRVQVFNGTGVALGTLGEGTLLYPGGIAASATEIFVSDSRNGRIVAFNVAGEVTRILGAGVLSAPQGLEVVADGLLVTDPGVREVVKLGFDGTVLAEYGGNWVLPYDVTTDGNFVYVADVTRNELGVASSDGIALDPIPLAEAPCQVWFRDGMLHFSSQA